MNTRFATLSLTALMSVLGAADAATPLVPDSSGAEVGLIRVECRPDDGAGLYRFRGVVVDTKTTGISHDVILTTAHGLPSAVDEIRQKCHVVGAQDERYPIAAIWRSDIRGRDSVDDWVVLATGQRLGGGLRRLRVRPMPSSALQQLVVAETVVRLPLRFVGGERACSLTPPGSAGVDLEVELFGHTCRAWPGHSGSPILFTADGELSILGIHLGSRWLFDINGSLEIGRFVDANVLDAIRAASAWRQH